MPRGALLTCLVAGCLALAPRQARGEPPQQARADQLFERAREHMRAGRYREACPLLEYSQRLDPGVGTLLHLGECYEKSNRAASAWQAFTQAQAMAAQQKQDERARLAQQRAEALAPRLSRVTIELTGATTGLLVFINGKQLTPAQIGAELLVDPGPQEIDARAPSHEPFRVSVSLDEGQKRKVTIPALDPAPQRTTAPEPPRPPAGRSQAAPSAAPPAVAAPSTQPADPGSGRTVAAVAALTAGTLALGGGLALGVRSLLLDREASRECAAGACSPRGQEATEGARTSATWSTVLVGAGLVTAGAGVFLWLTAPGKPSVSLAPTGASIRASF